MARRENLIHVLVALILSLSIWFVVNFGERLPLDIVIFVELQGKREGYVYKVEPKTVDITLIVSRRFLESKLLEKVRAVIYVSNLKEGTHKVRVQVLSPLPYFIQPVAVNPYYVNVTVIKEKR